MDRPELGLFDGVPYLHVTRTPGAEPRVRGTVSMSFGHRIERGPAERPDGIFGRWRWDGRRVTAENDRHGIFPLFYAANKDEFIISPSIFKLLQRGVSTDIHWAAVAVFLRAGFFVGEDTAFQAIRLVPPDAHLEWEDGDLRIAGGYTFPKPQRLDREAALDGYIELFREAIRRRLPTTNDFAVPLSGGRDSRHILLELCEQRHRPKFCITGRRYPPAGGEDERIAGLLTDALALRHVVVGPPPGQIRNQLRANVRTNMTAPRRAWKLAVAAYLKEHASISYDGIGGDMLSGGAAFDRRHDHLMESGRFEAYAHAVLRNDDTTLRRLVPAKQYHLMSREIAVTRLVQELARHSTAPNPTLSFNFWNRTRRFNSTSPYGVYADIPTVYGPFLDHDLCDLLASVPLDVTRDGRLHDDAIRAAYPRFSGIPFEEAETGAAFVPRARATLSRARELFAFILRNPTTQLVNRGWLLPRLVGGFTALGTWSAASWMLPIVVYLVQLEVIAYRSGVAVRSD